MILLWSLYVAIWYVIYIYHATKFLKSHDLKYVHPTSKVRTHTRRTWAHVKHGLLPTAATFLFFSVGFNMYQLARVQKVLPIAPIAHATENIIAETEYRIPFEYGDGTTHIARKAIKRYMDRNIVLIDEASFTNIENRLRDEFPNVPFSFQEGLEFKIQESVVSKYIATYTLTR